MPSEPARAPGKRPLVKQPWFWVTVGSVTLLVIFSVLFVAAVPLSSDILRHRIVHALSEQLDSDVELGDLHLRVFPGLRADGADLRIRSRGAALARYPPLIAIKSFHVDASVAGLMRKHVSHVQLDGLEIRIPPSEVRDRQKAEANANGAAKPDDGPPAPNDARSDPLNDKSVVIDRVDTNDARLVIIPLEADKAPKIWAIHHLRMFELGDTRPWPFQATLTNGVPPGEIDVDGNFGPWHRDEPGDTPLTGVFNFAKADLSVFNGIKGTLSSDGYFGGTLDEIRANGTSNTPDFTLDVAGHPFPLWVVYQALIDGTNGDTRLESIDGWFLHSYLHASGAVLDSPKKHEGRTVTLNVALTRSRIEDIMTMAVKADKPPMVGALTLNTTFVLPPGNSDVVDRLRLKGRFSIDKAQFTSYDVQGKINELSKRASAKTADPATPRALSDFAGHFVLGDGRLRLPDVTFATPGAKVELAGAYGMKAQTLDFKGQVLLDAKISQTVTGFKSILLRAIDPLLGRPNGTGSRIPVKIGGTRSDPKFGLDVHRVFHRNDPP
jgi:AsmA-like C-terminal region